MSGPYRDPTLNELREKYEQRIAELEASIVEHMDVERKAEVRAEKQKQRIADLTEDRDLWKQSEEAALGTIGNCQPGATN
jgi:chromosome segregation ATPase